MCLISFVVLLNTFPTFFVSEIGIRFYENCLRKAIEFKEDLDEAKVLTGYGKILTNIKVQNLYIIITSITYMYFIEYCLYIQQLYFKIFHNCGEISFCHESNFIFIKGRLCSSRK